MGQIQVTTKDEFRSFAEEFEKYIYSFFGIEPPDNETETEIELGDDLKAALELEEESDDRVNESHGILTYSIFSYRHKARNEIPCYFDFELNFDPEGDLLLVELESLSLESPFLRNKGFGSRFLKHFVDFFKNNKFETTDVELRIQPSGFGSFMLYVKHGFNIDFDSDSELIIFLNLLADHGIDSPEHFLLNQNSDAYNIEENYIAWRQWMDSQLSSGHLVKQYFCSGE